MHVCIRSINYLSNTSLLPGTVLCFWNLHSVGERQVMNKLENPQTNKYGDGVKMKEELKCSNRTNWRDLFRIQREKENSMQMIQMRKH